MTPRSPDRQRPLEYRSALELRAVGDRLAGYAVVFDTRSRDLGGFVEVVRPSAVDRSLGGDVVGLYNHDPGAVLGRTPKTLQLRKDARGLAFEIDPPATQVGRETVELVRRGDLTGASFGFRTVADRWVSENGVTVRELLDLDVIEISIVAIPAYAQTDVSVAKRSLLAWRQNGPPDEVLAQRIAFLKLRVRARVAPGVPPRRG